jgi:competence protein ComEC
MRYLLQVTDYDGAECNFRALLTVYSVASAYQRGDVLTVQGRLHTNEQYFDVPDQTDYSAYAMIDGIVARIGVQPDAVACVASQPTFAQSLYNRGSSSIENNIVLSGFDSATAAFLLATIAGDDLLLTDRLSDNFRTTGLAHVLALSGLHVGIIMALVAALLFGVRCLPGGRYAYYLLLAAAVMCYACITGMMPSVARAAVMVLVFIATKLAQRSQSIYNSVCVAVAVWLIVNPFWLWSPGLQLSVAAVLAIVWLGNRLNPYDYTQQGRRFVVGLFVVPIAAIVGTSMLTLFYFHSFPLWFLPSNIIAAVLAPLIIGGGAIATLLTATGISPGLLPDAVNMLYHCLEAVVTWFAELPGGQIENVYPDALQIGVYVACIAALIVALNKRRAAYYCIFGMLVVLLVAAFALKPYQQGRELYVPRVAASTDILIRSNTQALLVTNGGTAAVLRARQLYADFLGRRKAELKLAPDSFDIPGFSRRGNYVYFGDKVLKIITSESDVVTPTGRIDYALVGGGFKGDIAELANTVNADTIILAHSINAIRRTRYAVTLTALHRPHLSRLSVHSQ